MPNPNEAPQMPNSGDPRSEKLNQIKELKAAYASKLDFLNSQREEMWEAEDTYAGGGPVSEGPFKEDIDEIRKEVDEIGEKIATLVRELVNPDFVSIYLAEQPKSEMYSITASGALADMPMELIEQHSNPAEAKKEGLTISSDIFYEKVRQLGTVERLSPDVFKDIVLQIGEWAEGGGDLTRREAVYKGWSNEDLKELLTTIADKMSDQDDTRREKERLTPRKGEGLDPLFIEFKQYKAGHGEMTEKEFIAAQGWKYTGNDMERGLRKIMALNMGLPDIDFVRVFSKIDAQFPDKNDHWKMTEAYICMGKL